jgi:hypothetical protein
VHNAFRVYELIFWRKCGIRHESSVAATQEEGGQPVITYAFHTTEAFLAFAEGWIRGKMPKLAPVRLYIPVLQTTTGMPVFASPYLFAIAFDGSGNARTGAGSSLNMSVTTSGSNRVLVEQNMQNNASDVVTGVTYNAVAMTQKYAASPPSAMWIYYYTLIAPSTGANNVTISQSASTFIGAVAMSYTGANQTTQFLGIANNGTASGTSTSVTVNMTYNNSYCAGFGEVLSGANPTAGSGTVRRVINLSDGNSGFDSNGTVGATGNYTLNMSWAGAAPGYMQALEIVDVSPTPSGVNSGFFRAAMN